VDKRVVVFYEKNQFRATLPESGIGRKEKAPTSNWIFWNLIAQICQSIESFVRCDDSPAGFSRFRYISEIYISGARINNALLEKLGGRAGVTGVVSPPPVFGMAAEIDGRCTIRNKDFGT
jgi:hypothetical protein